MTTTRKTGASKAPDKQAGTKRTRALVDIVSWTAEDSMMFADATSPFQAHVVDGDPRLVLVTGENASGKSLFFRVVAAAAQQEGLVPVTLSIRERAGSGEHEMARLRQVMMFGNEHEQSTGATSVRVVDAGFGNLDRPDGSLLALDEPELGLSDGYARALGVYIGQQAQAVPDVCVGVVVVTHSRSLVRGLLEGYGTEPTFVTLDRGVADLDGWLTADEHRTVADLLALPDVGLDRFRAAAALLRHN